MDENGLMIGNAFTQKGSNFVEYVTLKTFELLSRNAIIIEPVLLNEKWLLKFGFKKIGVKNRYFDLTHFHYQDKNFRIYLIAKGFEIELELKNKDKDRFNFFRTYKFVHQLQNLYFAAIQEKLIIKK